MSRRLLLRSISVLTAYLCCISLAVWNHATTAGASSDPPAAVAPRGLQPARVTVAGLCKPTTRKRTLLVEVPFTQADVTSIEVAVSHWERAWPCSRATIAPTRPDLIFAFNANISEARYTDERARMSAVMQRPVVRACFGSVVLESAFLIGVDDTYDKRRLNANWTMGPNNLFFLFLRAAAARGYRFMAQLEPDILPLRSRWLEKLHCLAAHSTAWVIGSPFLSLCAHNTQTKKCSELGEAIKFHINGNALYAVGDVSFRAYWKRAFTGELRLWPFDLALHKYSMTLPEVLQRRLKAKFQPNPVVSPIPHMTRPATHSHHSTLINTSHPPTPLLLADSPPPPHVIPASSPPA